MIKTEFCFSDEIPFSTWYFAIDFEMPHLDAPSRTNSSKSGRNVLFRLTSRSNSGEDFTSALAHAIQTGDIDNIQVGVQTSYFVKVKVMVVYEIESTKRPQELATNNKGGEVMNARFSFQISVRR